MDVGRFRDKAMKLLSEAYILDNRGSYTEAILKYGQGLEHLLVYIRYVKDPKQIDFFQERASGYMDRIEFLKKRIGSSATACSASGAATAKPAGKGEMAGPMASDLCVIAKIRDASPLVHCITNFVSMDLAANVLLAAHASPAMVHAPEEAGGFAAIAGAVVINVGTIDRLWADGMRAAWRAAVAGGIPVVLDPVGVGAPGLFLRAEVCAEMCNKDAFVPALVRGNASEVAALSGLVGADVAASKAAVALAREWVAGAVARLGVGGSDGSFAVGDDAAVAVSASGPQGVDSTAAWHEALPAAVALARHGACAVAVTGEVDLVVASAGGEALFVGVSSNSNAILTKVTAAGCALSALCGAALAAWRAPSASLDPLEAGAAALQAVTLYGVAAERAVAAGAVGPGSVRTLLLDELHAITTEQLAAGARVVSTTLNVACS